MHRVLVTFALLLLPWCLSGIVRAETGVSLGAGLIVGVVATAALAGWAWWKRSRSHPRDRFEGLFLAAGAIGAGLMLWLLFRHDTGPLVTVGGGDAGNHVSLAHDFERTTPDTYQKFISLYALTAWLRRLFGFGDAQAFAAALYFAAAMVPLAIAAAASVLTRGVSARARIAAALAIAAAIVFTTVRIFGPWLHYHQADGFYGHLFGLAPLCIGWVAYAVTPRPVARIALLLGLVAAQRYTYGLNLGDWLIAAGICVLYESGELAKPKLRLAARIGGVGMFLASAIALRALWPLNEVPGAFVAPNLRATVAAEAMGCAVLALGLWRTRRRTEAARLLLLPLAFGATSLVLQLAAKTAGATVQYYFFKYTWHPQLWLCAAVTALAAGAVAGIVERERWAQVGIAAGVAAVFVFSASSVRPYWGTFRERAFSTPPLHSIDGLVDAALLARARAILAEHDARSGGVLDPSWPRANFLNAALDSYDAFAEGVPRFHSGKVDLSGGHCAFWLEGDPVSWANAAQRTTWESLAARADKVCVDHLRPWEPRRRWRLCHVCVAGAPTR